MPQNSSLSNIDEIGYIKNEPDDKIKGKIIYIYNIVSHIFIFVIHHYFFGYMLKTRR